MKKIRLALAAFSVMAIIAAGCGSSPSASSGTASTADELDIAIRDASDYLNGNIPAGSKIVILNIQSASADLSDYIIDELLANAVTDKIFSVVDRQQLDAIRSEQNFQWSGEVDDTSAMEIGKFFGAQTIVSGAVNRLGTGYRIRIRALEVQTAQVQGQYNRNIAASPIIAALIESGSSRSSAGGTGTRTAAASGGSPASSTPAPGSTGSQTAQPAAPAEPTAPALPSYKIGDTGPAGGLIFYDKGNNNGGWRYLEAAPADLPRPLQAATENFDQTDCSERAVGKGKPNTDAIMKIAVTRGGGFGWAAQACDAFSLNGYDDWFLPSRDELHYMYGHLHMQGLGNFRSESYWTSTGNGNNWSGTGYYFWYESFSDGRQSTNGNNASYRVRPIRQVPGPAGTVRSSADGVGGSGTAAVSANTGASSAASKGTQGKISIWTILGGILLAGVIAAVVIWGPAPEAATI